MMRKQSLKKAAALAISVMCMAGVFTGCGNNKSNNSSGDNANTDAKLTGSITAYVPIPLIVVALKPAPAPL